MSRIRKPSKAPRFKPGDEVRCRSGVTVPDFDDIPLGGWTGTIRMVEQEDDQVTYEIEWDEKTLDGMHPVYRNRCERDGLDRESMWLDEEDIEPDDGMPVPMEQPTEIRTPPLSMKDQDDRIRAVFGLTHDDLLPDVSEETLRVYHRYLAAHLKFPFVAFSGEEEVGPFSRKRATLTVTGLLDPRKYSLNEEDGLLCTARERDKEIRVPLWSLDVKKKDPNLPLVSDYSYWFGNWPWQEESPHDDPEEFDHDDPEEVDPGVETVMAPASPWWIIKPFVICGIAGGLLGGTIGAALQALGGAGPAAMIGGITLAMIGAVLLGRYGIIFGAVNRIGYGWLLGIIVGSLAGGLLGAVAALTIPAFPWSLGGAIAGAVVGPQIGLIPRQWSGSFRGAVLGILGGICVAAFRQDSARATAGAIPGAIAGTIAGCGLLIAAFIVMSRLPAGPWNVVALEEEEPGGPGDDDSHENILPMKATSRRRR